MSSSRDAAQLTGVATERCVSNGVGGAGNLRRPSVSKAMVAAINDDESPPRRSSVWSVNSNDGKPASIITVAKQMFRKGSSASVEEEPRTVFPNADIFFVTPEPIHTQLKTSDGRETAIALALHYLHSTSKLKITSTRSRMAMYVSDNPRRVKARRETVPYTISKYEHLEQLHNLFEDAGRLPVEPRKSLRAPGKTDDDESADQDGADSGRGRTARDPRIWRTRRRRDAKIFLGQEFVDNKGVIDDAKDTLLQLLNHPNLLSLMDVVRDSDISAGAMDYTVWENCSRGTLNRLLYHTVDEDPIEIPESLCWHVLEGISQALLWLHHGHKHTFPFDTHVWHDDDWHPILIGKITPANIYFTAPEDEATYGDVKLGCFQSATVVSSPMDISAPRPAWAASAYDPPEMRDLNQVWTAAAEVWSLGAVLYHMMVGHPPEEQDLSGLLPAPEFIGTEAPTDPAGLRGFYMRALPQRYSNELRDIVRAMLHFQEAKRPTAADLSVEVDRGMRIWREDTEEGERYRLKGEKRRYDIQGEVVERDLRLLA
ncbi:Serine/threonine/dual specificity protein kinase, catalytic domain [Lasallia pustulata]|uniref:non-specific serine/threonine protein kinase n=1 Tax=Lasallia pustulata TaxID=136370 RepID=A0A1W5DD00_9LECA|nr:Serine/threonine/dual specificity protein kinase, catalytic domain [Lasallia pustulata]